MPRTHGLKEHRISNDPRNSCGASARACNSCAAPVLNKWMQRATVAFELTASFLLLTLQIL
jgi:hypothetical protein